MIRNILISIITIIICFLSIEIYIRCFPIQEYETNNPYKYTSKRRISPNHYQEFVEGKYDLRGYYGKSNNVIDYYVKGGVGRYLPALAGLIDYSNNVVVLGDSFTFGFGLRYEDTWPYLAQNYLQSKLSWKFMNFGQLGADSIKCLNNYINVYQTIPHTMVIYGLHLNDLIAFPTSKIINDIEHQKHDILSESSHLYRFIIRSIETVKSRNRNIRDIHAQIDRDAERWKSNFEAIQQISEYAEQVDAEFLVVIFPIFFNLKEYPFRSAHNLASKMLAENDIEYVDLLDSFGNYNDRELWIFPFDQHPNEIANKIIAKKLCEKLLADYKIALVASPDATEGYVTK